MLDFGNQGGLLLTMDLANDSLQMENRKINLFMTTCKHQAAAWVPKIYYRTFESNTKILK
jgi:hypothetical protein